FHRLEHDVVLPDEGAACRGKQQSDQDLDGRRLAGAVRTEEAEELAAADFKAQSVERFLGAVFLHEPFDSNHGALGSELRDLSRSIRSIRSLRSSTNCAATRRVVASRLSSADPDARASRPFGSSSRRTQFPSSASMRTALGAASLAACGLLGPSTSKVR